MLNALKRWLGGGSSSVNLAAIKAWAEGAGYLLRRDRDSGKITIEGQFEQQRWRFEYGAPQRSYFQGMEARMRMELALPQELHLLLMSRALVENLETAAYARYTQSVETHLDHASAEELRWLVIYPKVALPQGSAVSRHFKMVASSPSAARAWLGGRVDERLGEFGEASLRDGTPFLLMTLRGRLYLRMQTPVLTVGLVEELVSLFRMVGGRARETLSDWTDEGDSAWTSTTSTAWHNELHVELPLDKTSS